MIVMIFSKREKWAIELELFELPHDSNDSIGAVNAAQRQTGDFRGRDTEFQVNSEIWE
jgi:hypothetical protein